MPDGKISVFLADDNLIVREGVRALIATAPDIEVVGVAGDYDGLVDGAERVAPQVIVTDIRMPPSFQREGIDAAKQVRKRHPGTGIVVLSQYDEPDYAISLLGEGAAGYAYLLKDRVAEGDQLFRAIREVTTGGSMLDPRIVEALVKPASQGSDLTPEEEDLLQMLAEGRPIKAIAAARRTTPADVDDAIEKLFFKLAQAASTGTASALRRLKMLHQAIVDREEQGETLSRLLPTGVAEILRRQGRKIGETETLTVTILMSDVRGYSTIAEDANPTVLAGQLNEHRAEMNRAILAQSGTVMQFVGDSVMAVFGAPLPAGDHAQRALVTAQAMHEAQSAVNTRWASEGLPPFYLGIGLSTGEVAAALLGSAERLEYSLVGDSVNLCQRLQQFAQPGETILSEATYRALGGSIKAEALPPTQVKGRHAAVQAYRIAALTPA
ncbi:MAG TPA: adenylate/guanylate cyclase domain-containing protein [Candidatus Acidoferrum sp.]|nr:adenylate/guanylate cyclase domain-containing protein [Candidatus Acidoferrum sp.]